MLQQVVYEGFNGRKLVCYEENLENPIIVIDTGGVKIEDRTLTINNKEILNKIREIDFDKSYDINCPNSYSGDFWELIVDDKKYQGVLEDPHYVVKLKKIIRFNAIQVYASKKLAGYIKS